MRYHWNHTPVVPSWWKMRKPTFRVNTRWLVAAFAVVGLAAVFAGVRWARLSRDKWLDDLWLEVAKAGVQVVAVGVVGGALTVVWRDITAKREERALAEAKIAAELVSLVALYNDLKCVRRTIRSLGLDLKTYPIAEREVVRRHALLTEEQAKGFHEQMVILNRLQLGFEAKARQFGQTDLLGEAAVEVVGKLGQIENHLNGALALWEQSGWTVREGTRLGFVYDGLEPLLRVRTHLRPNVSDPMRRITALVNEHVFGKASTDTRIAFDRVVTSHDGRDD